MPQITLTADQKNKIKNALQAFAKYVKSEEFAADQTERLARVNYFQRELPQKLKELSEADIDELVVKLWASRSSTTVPSASTTSERQACR